MLRESDFCRNLRATVVGTWGGMKQRRTCRQEMGAWAQWKPILPPCKLDLRRAPTMAVLMHPACEFKQPLSVCWGRKLWFHWLRPEVISCLDRKKEVTESICRAHGTPVSKKVPHPPPAHPRGSTCMTSLPLGDFVCTPGIQKRIHFLYRKDTHKFEFIFIFVLRKAQFLC